MGLEKQNSGTGIFCETCDKEIVDSYFTVDDKIYCSLLCAPRKGPGPIPLAIPPVTSTNECK